MARASTAAANDTGELDPLWSVPPEKFVAARNAAIAALKKAGDTEGAAHLKAVKRPTPSAWLVNALVRTAPKEVDAVFHAGDALIRAQGRVLAGADPDEMHSAMRGVREAVSHAMKRARAILAENGRKPTPDLTRRVTHTLRSASLDRRLRDLVLAARLTSDPNVDELDALTEVPVPKRTAATPKKRAVEARPPKKKKAASARDHRAAEKRAAREKQLREREERASRARAEREARAERAREEREAKKQAARDAREKLRAEVTEAAAAAEEARRALANAQAEERRARHAAEEAAREVARAQRDFETARARHARAKKRAR